MSGKGRGKLQEIEQQQSIKPHLGHLWRWSRAPTSLETKLKKLLSICAVPVLAAAFLAAQDQPASSTDPQSGEQTRANAPRRAEDRDWGWIGLFGLAGLAGLRRRRDVEVVRMQDRTRDTEASGIRRAS
jgi:MYXO-CTERM domain-containing protein